MLRWFVVKTKRVKVPQGAPNIVGLGGFCKKQTGESPEQMYRDTVNIEPLCSAKNKPQLYFVPIF